ncbi:hypothetical protein A3B18_01660 [Candidatus Giovannonibacteria bacterium RIFCSPLOWO2_01_FULL_46_13]|uniref:Uncharacterized protein n=1 Tax=Candidatus Giovannonibacteria bacterium RIFCSPLOWO2_01_FULL_46_13 TaxID=1798352 RepID=A0A1F5X5H4_9BACT|nr:MAG: hypothetical protein A3B18_01660 [Candidatus Giovannonibacteria bacterium RIFCSPLOWO2_01_FULL_46_13]
MSEDGAVFLPQHDGWDSKPYKIKFDQSPQNERERERWARAIKPRDPRDLLIGYTQYGTYIPLK